MTAGSTAFEHHLIPDESPVAVETGTLVEETRARPAAICLTDRRILLVAEDGGFVDVPRDQVRSIRSRATTSRSDRELLGLLLAVGGIALAAIAGGVLLVGAGSATLAAATVAAVGTVAAGAVWRLDVSLRGRHVAAATDRIGCRFRQVDALGHAVGLGRYEDRVAAVVDEQPLVFAAAALVGVAGAAALVALGAWTALAATGGALAGFAVADGGVRSLRALEASGERIRRERAVSLRLVDGHEVRFRVDADATIDRELSQLTGRRVVAELPGEGRGSGEVAAETGASGGS